nr:hypothetical protein [Tanacetum cinerariifolium]
PYQPSIKSLKSKESSKGKTPSNISKSGKYVSAEKSVYESEHVMPMDVKEPNLDNVTNDADEKQVDDIPMIPKKEWFKQSPRPETLDPDSNMVKTVDDAPEQSWFNKMIQAEKPPLTFDELMSTPIDFAVFAMNRLKLNKITRADLVDQLDSTNPEGHKRPVDMSKPLPLQDKEGQLIIPLKFFFNNDLEYLKAKSSERRYSSSITKTPAARTQVMASPLYVQRAFPKDENIKNIKVVLHSIHSDDGNLTSANIRQALRQDHVKMEKDTPRSSRLKFITACS